MPHLFPPFALREIEGERRDVSGRRGGVGANGGRTGKVWVNRGLGGDVYSPPI